MRKLTPEEREVIQTVLYDLERYQGEEIVKDQHPLHLSVQKLESLCRPKGKDRSKGQSGVETQAKLFQPACRYWFRSVWASREGKPNYPDCSRDKRPDIALEWAVKLGQELQSWLTEGMPSK